MTISKKTKGSSGELEICTIFNRQADLVRKGLGLVSLAKEDKHFQRNLNQTSTGGSDVSNPFGLEIEVKRQEKLQINTWWEQVLKASKRKPGSTPVLIYRQNRKAWNVATWGYCVTSDLKHSHPTRITISIEDYIPLLRKIIQEKLQNNNDLR